MDFMDRYNLWLNSPYIDDGTKQKIREVTDKKIIEDMFYKDLEFGTGGLRGIIGPGTNRMNIYVVRRASQGISNYIKRFGESAKLRGVAIAYDSRHKSREFAMEAASVFAGNGIKAYVFDDLRPTPELSYAVRKLSAIAGVVITASHNPPEYNGYKVYWEDGAQVSLDAANEIQAEINNVSDFSHILYKNLDTAIQNGLFSIIGTEIDNMYLSDVNSLLLNKEIIKKHSKDFKIIYTPLHGTGNKPVRKSLSLAGFENVYVVKEQEMPDPDFSTVKSPNPEEHSAFEIALKMAHDIKPDLILGTDPDCDRLGICVLNNDKEYVTLTGNQVGALLTEYILSQLKEKGKLTKNGVVVKTIVTSELGRKIAASYGIDTIDTLTGFKYIGEKIKEFERTLKHTFILGYEESYGYLAGTFVRDKDAVIASTLVSEMGAYYKDKGTTLYQALSNIYKKYGYYVEKLKSIILKGVEGNDHILRIMENLRSNPPVKVDTENIVNVKDYINGFDNLPKANVLQLITDKNSIISIRPSGTEPKIKIYYSVNGKNRDEVEKRTGSLIESFEKIVDKIK
ncbi:MAG TPA: phosphoglucomutase [Clostridiaceae bacterium]|nr:phosphoglucomutase [Clostridiaceae bacterium]